MLQREGEAPRSHEMFVRLYTPDALRKALADAGLRIRDAFGGWDGSPLSLDGGRIMLLADAV